MVLCRWFEGFNWDGVANRKLVPPIVKNVRFTCLLLRCSFVKGRWLLLQIQSPLDTSNFDRYERTNEAPPPDDNTGWDKEF